MTPPGRNAQLHPSMGTTGVAALAANQDIGRRMVGGNQDA